MRGLFVVAMALLAGGCSCDRRPEERTMPSAATAQPEPERAAMDSTAQVTQREAEERAAAMSQAASTTHAYLAALAAKDWDKANAFWVGGKPPPRPDDYTVRGIEDLSALRINNDAPKPLDQESPPRSFEVPVTLRVSKEKGSYEIKGWYRLRRKVADDGWEITSASLRPTLD